MAEITVKASASGTIRLYVFWILSNVIIRFLTDKHEKMKKLMDIYCERHGVSMATVEFLFNGQPINGDDTPLSLEMEEGDVIEVNQL